MDTELAIEYLRGNWWVLLLIICMTSYFLYSYVKYHLIRASILNRKKQLEKELVELKAKYDEQVKKLEKRMSERPKFINKGRG